MNKKRYIYTNEKDNKLINFLSSNTYMCEITMKEGGWKFLGELKFNDRSLQFCEKECSEFYHNDNFNEIFFKTVSHSNVVIRFTENFIGFTGEFTDQSGNLYNLRGSTSLIYNTTRTLTENTFEEEWLTFKLISKWKDSFEMGMVLETKFYLGEEDISNRTGITRLANYKTSIKMLKKFPKKDYFDIVLEMFGDTFSGIYVDKSNNNYKWTGKRIYEL